MPAFTWWTNFDIDIWRSQSFTSLSGVYIPCLSLSLVAISSFKQFHFRQQTRPRIFQLIYLTPQLLLSASRSLRSIDLSNPLLQTSERVAECKTHLMLSSFHEDILFISLKAPHICSL